MKQSNAKAGYAPAQTIQQSPVSRQFYYWLGASGERYLHTVFPIDADFTAIGANFIVVRRDPDGGRIPLYIGRMGDITKQEIEDMGWMSDANELHIHLMATNNAAADKIATDLDTRHFAEADAQPGLFDMPHAPQPGVFFANVNF